MAYANVDLILRRPPAGSKAKSADNMGREYRLQIALKPVFPFVPTMRVHCEAPAVIGAEFYVMDHVSGIILRCNPPPARPSAGHAQPARGGGPLDPILFR